MPIKLDDTERDSYTTLDNKTIVSLCSSVSPRRLLFLTIWPSQKSTKFIFWVIYGLYYLLYVPPGLKPSLHLNKKNELFLTKQILRRFFEELLPEWNSWDNPRTTFSKSFKNSLRGFSRNSSTMPSAFLQEFPLEFLRDLLMRFSRRLCRIPSKVAFMIPLWITLMIPLGEISCGGPVEMDAKWTAFRANVRGVARLGFCHEKTTILL